MLSMAIDAPMDISDEHQRAAEELHSCAVGLPRLDFEVRRTDVPANGVYLLFEIGELARIGDQETGRIVRVGTHRAHGGLHRRLQRHVQGSRRTSVFRLHLGGALLARVDSAHPHLTSWLDRRGDRMPEIEEQVSAELRGRFSVACLPVDTMGDRLTMERGLIGLLARHPQLVPLPE